MGNLPSPARRYIWALILAGSLVAVLNVGCLPEQSLWLWPLLVTQAAGSLIAKRREPSVRFKRLASASLFFLGATLLLWQLPHLSEPSTWVLLALGILAAATHTVKQPGPTPRSSYQMSFMVYGFTLALLGGTAAVTVIIIAHVIEYAWGSYYPWYIQSFNLAALAVSAGVAGLVFDYVSQVPAAYGMVETLAAVAAMSLVTLLNHLFIGSVLKLARGQSFTESGVFGSLTLMIDFGHLCLGAGTAEIWRSNPSAIVLGAVPLYLLYTALRVPALERRAETDDKTGLYNAGFFKQAMLAELARSDRFDRPLAVVMADLDLLRDINNAYGHLAGDHVLRGVAQTIQELARDFDIVARFGGEEFAVLMPETSAGDAKSMAESMRSAVASLDFDVTSSAEPLRVTMSFGVAVRNDETPSADSLVHRADLALYKAKEAGRNRVVLYDELPSL